MPACLPACCPQAIASSSPFLAASTGMGNPPAGGATSMPSSQPTTPLSLHHPLGLYVEVLNHYLDYYEAGTRGFTPLVVQQLIDHVQVRALGWSVVPPGPAPSARWWACTHSCKWCVESSGA